MDQLFFDNKKVYLVNTPMTTYDLPWPYDPPERYIEFEDVNFIVNTFPKNKIYEGIRNLLYIMGLDKSNFNTPKWNPLREFVKEGDKVAIKPNFVRHFNEDPDQSLDVVITHMAVIRPLIDYAFLAVGKTGIVRIVEAPQADCKIDIIIKKFRIKELVQYYKEQGYNFEFIDTRKEMMNIKEGVILGIDPLPGDPNGYTIAKLNKNSEFFDKKIKPELLRGTDYEYDETAEHHTGEKHEYLISNSVLQNDLVINVPKIKTHYKIGLTVALKNLVGINGDKNWLPHWRKGTIDEGGDQFKDVTFFNKLKSNLLEKMAPILKLKPIAYLAMLGATLIHRMGFRNNFGCGTWFGNDTIWRTTLDLNKILFYMDEKGNFTGDLYNKRKYITICDGIISGEGKGPMGPVAKPLGILVGATNPAYCDLVIARLMGFDYRKIKFLEKLFHIEKLPLIKLKNINELKLIQFKDNQISEYEYNNININYKFEAPPNWKGFIEIEE